MHWEHCGAPILCFGPWTWFTKTPVDLDAEIHRLCHQWGCARGQIEAGPKIPTLPILHDHTMYSSRKDFQIHLEEGLAVYDEPRG